METSLGVLDSQGVQFFLLILVRVKEMSLVV